MNEAVRRSLELLSICTTLVCAGLALAGEPAAPVANDDYAARIIGPDANRNTVRDDIDAYIDSTYPDPREHAAMVQFAQAYTQLLIHGGTVAGARAATKDVARAVQCGIGVFGDSNIEKQKAVLAMILNSEARFQAYTVSTHNEEGQVVERFTGEPCL